MSVCPHRQHCHFPKLPKCLNCRTEVTKVVVSYDSKSGSELKVEWECPKCKKYFAEGVLTEEVDPLFAYLHGRFGSELQKPKKTKKRR